MDSTLLLLLAVGTLFGGLGAACAWLITYKEWQHHYATPEMPKKLAWETALFAFALFMGLMIVVWLFFR